METLQWTIVLFVVAAILTVVVYFALKLKKFIKLPAKKPKQPKNKNVKEGELTVEPVQEKPTYSLENKKKKPVERFEGTEQGYEPSQEFASEKVEYSAFAQPSMRRRRPMPQPVQRQAPPADDFEKFRREHGYSETIKDQIRNLSPEMKAILFGNVLAKKDDQF